MLHKNLGKTIRDVNRNCEIRDLGFEFRIVIKFFRNIIYYFSNTIYYDISIYKKFLIKLKIRIILEQFIYK